MQDRQHTENLPFIPTIRVHDYRYSLPEERIAAYPLAERDASKLLIADMRSNAPDAVQIRHSTFRHIAHEIPSDALLVANDSRVIAARIRMQKKATGGSAEVLCLQPLSPSPEPALALQSTGHCRWQCMVGGRKIVVGDTLIASTAYSTLTATIVSKEGAEAVVEFSWQPKELSFAAVLEHFGHIPLPPYIKRDDDADDKQRYQTVYAAHDGSVAAPTAGLHFTERVLEDLAQKGIRRAHVTLHVGAGTFKPMNGTEAREHTMHEERIFVGSDVIAQLAEQLERNEQSPGGEGRQEPIIAVGTTSLRTLESLYWWGVRLLTSDGDAQERDTLDVRQWDALRLQDTFRDKLPSPTLAMRTIQEWLQTRQMDVLTGETQIMITPGYSFAVCDGLITNFHQPESTLMLLVAAFLTAKSETHWRTVYDAALANGYRFLSYGDSSLLWRA